jgi:hypothetical protein
VGVGPPREPHPMTRTTICARTDEYAASTTTRNRRTSGLQ